MDESESALITAWQHGNEQAVRTIFEKHYPRLVRLAVLSGLTMEEAEDCSQEAFLRAFERRHQLRDPCAFPLWFQRIVTRHLLNTLGRMSRTRQSSLEVVGEVSEDWGRAQVQQPDEITISAEDRTLLWQAVQALPVTYRLPLVLRYYDDFSLHEIAEIIGKREGTVRVTIHRALQQLRQAAQSRRTIDQPTASFEQASTMTITQKVYREVLP
ncbi:MAG TPA: RNA polymerase sigma factor [Ktedonobacteraceae bacterium]|nr:RNA polymerase sigma factor [Ktedonobacteraceae bacterium]